MPKDNYLILRLLCSQLTQARAPLRGWVQDAAGRPVPFASVAVLALAQGTTVAAAGAFRQLTIINYQLSINNY